MGNQRAVKLLVTGNCQARPLEQIICRHSSFEPLPPIILHLATPDQKEQDCAALSEADIILAQLTEDGFAADWLRSSALKQKYPGKVKVWPNVFYSGQQPWLRYLTHPEMGRVMGPMEGYHDLRFMREWLGLACGIDWRPEIDDPGFAAQVAERSAQVLETREAGCDVGITDVIRQESGARPLFYSFNHPSVWLLSRLAERILELLGQPANINASSEREMLDRAIVPSVWLDETAADLRPYKGFSVNRTRGGRVTLGKGNVFYSAVTLKETAFACYGHELLGVDPDTLRLTPHY